MVALIGMAAALPPMPPLPTVAPAAAKKPALRTPRASEQVKSFGTAMAVISKAVAFKPVVVTLAADFPKPQYKQIQFLTNHLSTNFITFTNGRVFIDVTTNLAKPVWVRVADMPWTTNGGTLKVPYTNNGGNIFFRAGWYFK